MSLNLAECRQTQPESAQMLRAPGEREGSRVDGGRDRVSPEAATESCRQRVCTLQAMGKHGVLLSDLTRSQLLDIKGLDLVTLPKYMEYLL